MFQQPGRFRSASSDIGAIDRRLRALEHNFQRIAGDTSAGAAELASQFGGTLAVALTSLADRFRDSRDEAGKFGRDAARLGDDALRRVFDEVERRPLVTLAVAIGVGILIGLASRRSDRR